MGSRHGWLQRMLDVKGPRTRFRRSTGGTGLTASCPSATTRSPSFRGTDRRTATTVRRLGGEWCISASARSIDLIKRSTSTSSPRAATTIGGRRLGFRRSLVLQALAAQDGLHTVIARGADRDDARAIGAMSQ